MIKERMTERDEYGNADIVGVGSISLQCNLAFNEFNKVTEALNRLAYYEDLDEQGQLMILPCEVGSNVYFVNEATREVCTATVIGAGINLFTPQCPLWLHIEYVSGLTGKHEYHSRYDLIWGKKVFTKRHEAEIALAAASDVKGD